MANLNTHQAPQHKYSQLINNKKLVLVRMLFDFRSDQRKNLLQPHMVLELFYRKPSTIFFNKTQTITLVDLSLGFFLRVMIVVSFLLPSVVDIVCA